MENEIGRRANEYYGMVKVQLWFLDGMADAEFNKPRQFPENGAMYYRQHAYHQGYEQWKIVKERRWVMKIIYTRSYIKGIMVVERFFATPKDIEFPSPELQYHTYLKNRQILNPKLEGGE